jgi:glycerol-3-phosphate cytidylyltransferase
MPQRNRETLVYTVGVWDMFHLGHLNLLKTAKALGDRLIVGVNTDELVLQYKGHLPLLCFEDRIAVVQACRYVDCAIPATSLEKDALLRELDVDILVHGDDKRILGHDFMVNNKRRVVYVPYTAGRSSTILRAALSRYYADQAKCELPGAKS